ncbi:MAG TPA: response regulator [Candidatus Obscuribacter sp.]|nr:response regulator [Candidatus Obscuribacter sp.]MBK9278184.1 response regulator [Candidatus Obscuribacter sp.]MBL8081202.1 response regulator [Candidatus Obscuribacter sp.]HNB14083.1 response regulator [Candidatus Obscuribacter sp.]HNG20841.1 response regulator [Candidatus Obscuribacter sp.]
MKVLIIDDEEDFRTVASSCLGLLNGAEVFEAGSGAEGIDLACQEKPDVILLDLCMPGMDGKQTLRNLRERPAASDVPVIFCTTVGMFEQFEEMKTMGALAVITKPFDPLKLYEQINTILVTAGKMPASEGEGKVQFKLVEVVCDPEENVPPPDE